MSDWAVRNERESTQTGFGENRELALATYNALVEKAGTTGTGGEFALLCDGVVVSRGFVPGRGEP